MGSLLRLPLSWEYWARGCSEAETPEVPSVAYAPPEPVRPTTRQTQRVSLLYSGRATMLNFSSVPLPLWKGTVNWLRGYSSGHWKPPLPAPSVPGAERPTPWPWRPSATKPALATASLKGSEGSGAATRGWLGAKPKRSAP